ncbi:hypothetical protein Glove_38g77 [Diversispora epigaea]|uniref:Uncharacterized protein n=1 Tax=Diversispora epigaea TaxID=1348612 RepID=A0A397JQR5_9GLOM|nr:hypothetical protein Glove_38g77 [Diversispora epigaea]
MSTDLQTKIYNFLVNAEERHINATAVIHQGLEENLWISQTELRSIVDRVVGYFSISNPNSPSRQLKLIKVLSQYKKYFNADCTSEKQSVASANRKGDGFMGRRPDIMFVAKYRETIFELMYVECSHLICTAQKKIDDDVKLWRECNDGLFWVRQTVEIPVQFSDGRVVYKFIETLLLLHNLLITNLSLLYHGTVTSSQRLKEGSTTVTTPRDDYP